MDSPGFRNSRFYERLWSESRFLGPERFNTWPLVRSLAESARERLEVGPGLRPRLPIESTCFVDISRSALERLCAEGASGVRGEATALPFPDGRFELVAAFDIIEHVADDDLVFRELRRVLRPGGTLVFSVPLYDRHWTAFDDLVGHFHRYEPDRLEHLLAENGFVLEQSAVFGMQPKGGWLLDLGTYMLKWHRAKAMRWYNFFLPIGVYFQKPLKFEPGLTRREGVDEVLLVCRRRPRGND